MRSLLMQTTWRFIENFHIPRVLMGIDRENITCRAFLTLFQKSCSILIPHQDSKGTAKFLLLFRPNNVMFGICSVHARMHTFHCSIQFKMNEYCNIPSVLTLCKVLMFFVAEFVVFKCTVLRCMYAYV